MLQQSFEKKKMLKQDENAIKISRRTKHLCYPFFSGGNIQHAVMPCQRKNQQTYKEIYMFIVVSKCCKSFNMFNYNEAMQPKQRGKAVYDNTGTIECSLKVYITYGASVYMWHEGSCSSDVYWFRAKLEWGKGRQDYGHFRGINENICSQCVYLI